MKKFEMQVEWADQNCPQFLGKLMSATVISIVQQKCSYLKMAGKGGSEIILNNPTDQTMRELIVGSINSHPGESEMVAVNIVPALASIDEKTGAATLTATAGAMKI